MSLVLEGGKPIGNQSGGGSRTRTGLPVGTCDRRVCRFRRVLPGYTAHKAAGAHLGEEPRPASLPFLSRFARLDASESFHQASRHQSFGAAAN